MARSKWYFSSSANGLREMLHRNWYLGFTAFGGPAVHFQIVSPVNRTHCTYILANTSYIVSSIVCGETRLAGPTDGDSLLEEQCL